MTRKERHRLARLVDDFTLALVEVLAHRANYANFRGTPEEPSFGARLSEHALRVVGKKSPDAYINESLEKYARLKSQITFRPNRKRQLSPKQKMKLIAGFPPDHSFNIADLPREIEIQQHLLTSHGTRVFQPHEHEKVEQFSRDLFLFYNAVGRLLNVRAQIVREVGGTPDAATARKWIRGAMAIAASVEPKVA
jgi:hypothetical protein